MPEEKVVNKELEEYKAHVEQVFQSQYKSLYERLQAEPNIILRYELKLSLDMLMNLYKDINKEG